MSPIFSSARCFRPSDVEDNQGCLFPSRGRAHAAVNLPNYITLSRIFSIPLLMWILSTDRLHQHQWRKGTPASVLFIAASITDGIDGYLAREEGQITTMGILLDPLADKLLFAAAFVTLGAIHSRLFTAWMAVVIIGREFLVSGLRSIAASEGFTIEASDLGQLKMLVQIVSVVAVIACARWREWPDLWPATSFPFNRIARVAIWFMVFLSLVSAVDYFVAFWSRIDRRVVKKDQRRRRAFRPEPTEKTRCPRHLKRSPPRVSPEVKLKMNIRPKSVSSCSPSRTSPSRLRSLHKIFPARRPHFTWAKVAEFLPLSICGTNCVAASATLSLLSAFIGR